ncbi:MAG: extracellular solute-binding protein [Candidatus Parcubacteria bacterium]|nr:extracellular solute-binding protein [Candidatus Parcubacteria bacterium]
MKISLFKGILIGAFILGALIGLFVFATYTSKNSGGANAIGTVVIWGALPSAEMEATLVAATGIDPSLKSVSYVQKDPATLPADLASAIAIGAAPDLILASQEELQPLTKFISPISSATLSQSTFANAFIGGAEIFTMPGGTGYWGIPFLVDPLVLFSNRAILESTGIARPPASWEALTGLVPNTAILTPSRQIMRGLIALGTYTNVHDARGILSTLFLQQGVPVSGYSASGNLSANLGLSTSVGRAPGPAVLGFYTQFADPSKVSYTWNASLPDSQQSFLSGDLALYLGYVSEARYLRAANPNLDFSVSVVPQPSTSQLKSTYGLIYAFMAPRGARNPAGAYQTAVLLTNSAEQIVAAASTGLAPATLTLLSSIPSDPIATVAYAEALYTHGWLSPAPLNTDSVFSGMIGSVISGRLNLQSALVSAEQSLTAFLQQ